MFDIAWSELLIVAVVAVVVIGPKDVPKAMRVAGQWAGRARAMADQFKRSFDDMARQSELEELRAEMRNIQNSKTLEEIQRETDFMVGYVPEALVTDASGAPLPPILPEPLSPEALAAETSAAEVAPPESTPAAKHGEEG